MVSRDEVFDRNRPLLFSIAYRMTGSVMDAEDAVQEAYLRWQRASEDEVRSPSAYLSKVVTRLCIDRLRSARVRREQYVGPWLPEPLLGEQAKEIAGKAELEDSLSMAFLVLLESLTPVERVVFLLREVFAYEYAEIASLVGKSEANCRQISRRARQSLAARRPRFESSPQQEERLQEALHQASIGGDLEALLELLSEDVTLYSDGGGKTRAALRPIYGADSVARFLTGILRNIPPDFAVRLTRVNGRPGLVGYFGDSSPQSVVTLEVAEGSIRTIRLVVNPEKLGSVPPPEHAERRGLEMNPPQVLVTGRTGVLGRRVVERLGSEGVGARVFSRSGRPGTIRGDLLTGEGLEPAVQGVDTIIHCASSPFRKARKVDVEGTGRLLEAPQRPVSRTSPISPSSA